MEHQCLPVELVEIFVAESRCQGMTVKANLSAVGPSKWVEVDPDDTLVLARPAPDRHVFPSLKRDGAGRT
jgi:hypothetical protein